MWYFVDQLKFKNSLCKSIRRSVQNNLLIGLIMVNLSQREYASFLVP